LCNGLVAAKSSTRWGKFKFCMTIKFFNWKYYWFCSKNKVIYRNDYYFLETKFFFRFFMEPELLLETMFFFLHKNEDNVFIEKRRFVLKMFCF
jgi:hypothetical protein